MKVIGTNSFLVRHNNKNSHSSKLSFNTQLSNISSDIVCFKGESTNILEKPNWINKSVGDKILNLIKKYPFENLEFVDNNNDLIYALRTLPKNGFIFVYKQNILDDRLEYFSAGVHYPSIKSKFNKEDEYTESNSHQYIWEFGGNQFYDPYDGQECKPIKFNFAQTARKVEAIYQEILDKVENGSIKAYDGSISPKAKPYDDLGITQRKHKLRIAAFHTLLLQKQPKNATKKDLTLVNNAANLSTDIHLTSSVKPTRKEIDALVNQFLEQRDLCQKNIARKEWKYNTPDSQKYQIALEKQQQKIQADSTPVSVAENRKNTGLVIDRTGVFSSRKDTTPANDFPNKADVTNINRDKRRKQPITKEDILFGSPLDPNSDTAKFYRALRKQQEEEYRKQKEEYGKQLPTTPSGQSTRRKRTEHLHLVKKNT